jgi:hypothetical protein
MSARPAGEPQWSGGVTVRVRPKPRAKPSAESAGARVGLWRLPDPVWCRLPVARLGRSEVCTGVCTRRAFVPCVSRLSRITMRNRRYAEAVNGRYWARTSDPQLVELVRGVCAPDRFSAQNASEQGFLRRWNASKLRRSAAFCAHGVGCMWGGGVARSENERRCCTSGCICVSARGACRGVAAC